MGLVLAVLFLVLAIAVAIVYGGTPHGGPTTTCGPITVFGHHFTISADCRYVSVSELVVATVFFLLAVFTALAARPRR